MKWYAMFSQTGSEIYEVSKKLSRYPDMVLCNKQDGFESINKNLIGKASIIFTDKSPTVDQYLHYIPEDALVTMHGWLRIVPGEVCKKRDIYNGHPGLISEFPQLKGKDPQQKAIDLKLEYTGCVLHKATAELDGGPITLCSEKVYLKGLSDDQVFEALHKSSVDMWTKFLTKKLNERN
jgi:folate-dependent phosphoribosylglycinamide formyltransferase PurN